MNSFICRNIRDMDFTIDLHSLLIFHRRNKVIQGTVFIHTQQMFSSPAL